MEPAPAALDNVVRTRAGLTDAHRDAFTNVRLLLSAGAPIRPSLLRAAADLFPNAAAHTPYGMTECLPVADIDLVGIAAATRDGSSSGDGVCVGLPLPEVEVLVRPLDEAGHATGEPVRDPGVLGEIIVRAGHARLGYDRLWHTEHTASRPPGWHSTGDVGHLDEHGRLWVGGRLGHVITTPGGPVAPVRLEQAIEAIDEVSGAAVVGVGPCGAQQIVAVVRPESPPRSPRSASLPLVDAVRAAVASVGDEAVAAVFEVGALPVDRRHNSKIDRTRVAAWAATATAGRRPGTL